MSGATQPPPPDGALRVLLAVADPSVAQLIERAIAANGDALVAVTDLAEAIATAAGEKPEIAFVDVAFDNGAGLALVHHLTAVAPGIAVYAIAPEANVEAGSQAVALGAAGVVPSPPSGDALLHAVGQVREKRAAAQVKIRLEADLAMIRRRSELVNRVVRLAHGGGHSEVARAVMEAMAEVSLARGAAIYAAFDPPQGECVRLAVMGTSHDLPANAPGEDLLRQASGRGATVVPIGAGERLLAIAILEREDPSRERDIQAMANLAATVLAFVDDGDTRMRDQTRDGRARVYPFHYLKDIAGREIDKARRHQRRLAIAGVLLDPEASPKMRGELEETVLSVVRDTDVLARFEENELYLLLPETGAHGAHTCRRRLLVRAEGDRRAKPPTSDRRGPVASRPSRGVHAAIGIATFPHDGTSLERLLRAARQRAKEAARSSVHTLGLAPLALGEVVDTLLAKPLGLGPPYPLDLSLTSLLAVVTGACREARRAGAVSVVVSARPGLGMATAARQAFAGDSETEATLHVADVRGAARCEDIEAIVLTAEHGTWVCCGRVDGDRFRGVHAIDPILCDLVAQRLAQAGGIRLP